MAVFNGPPGDALMSGHTALSWVQGGINYVVSLHGLSKLNQQLCLIIAEHVRLVG